MIPLEKLRAIRTVISHANCPDGMASAMIVKDAIYDVEVLFMQYGTAELAALRPAPGQLFVDFSPPRERAAEFVAAGAICLDHHKTARDVVESFGELGVYADATSEPGVGGATLAFREVWAPLLTPRRDVTDDHLTRIGRFANLAGIRDTWQTKSPAWREACAQAEALRFWPTSKLLDAPFDHAPGGVFDLMRVAPALMAQLLGPVLDALRTKKPKNFQAAAFTFEGDSWDLELRRVGGESMAMKYAAAVDELERSRPVVDAAIAWQAAFFVDGAPSLSGDGETTVEQENAVDALDVALDDYHAKEGP